MALRLEQLIDDLRNDVGKAAKTAGKAWVVAVKREPSVPYDKGNLQDGIQLISTKPTKSGAIIEIASTTKRTGYKKTSSGPNSSGFDYPAYLDDRSNKHRGWWGKVTEKQTIEKAFDALISEL